ncbi:MAG: hypothetical protein ACRD4P_10380 [Bryobacteraceae bacterium]
MNDPIASRRSLDFSEELSSLGWYHSFALPDGQTIHGYSALEMLEQRYADFQFPKNLNGTELKS